MNQLKIRIWDGKEMHYNIEWFSNDAFCTSIYDDSWISGEMSLFTGNVDKKGTDIYFGDLVKAPSGKIFKVIWDDEGLSIRIQSKDLFYYNFNVPLFEVIGNIYQDKKLFINQ